MSGEVVRKDDMPGNGAHTNTPFFGTWNGQALKGDWLMDGSLLASLPFLLFKFHDVLQAPDYLRLAAYDAFLLACCAWRHLRPGSYVRWRGLWGAAMRVAGFLLIPHAKLYGSMLARWPWADRPGPGADGAAAPGGLGALCGLSALLLVASKAPWVAGAGLAFRIALPGHTLLQLALVLWLARDNAALCRQLGASAPAQARLLLRLREWTAWLVGWAAPVPLPLGSGGAGGAPAQAQALCEAALLSWQGLVGFLLPVLLHAAHESQAYARWLAEAPPGAAAARPAGPWHALYSSVHSAMQQGGTLNRALLCLLAAGSWWVAALALCA